ncbi:MAG: T9SS type A sorting domain-containing protein [Bacteroidia bacterium]|nr:T9SS type A sorting domain-containing protein [Bacteroidia bacterium]
MRKLVLAFLFVVTSTVTWAQNINYQVQVAYLGWNGRGDQSGGAEYGLFVWGRDNVNATQVGGQCFYTGDVGTGAGNVTSTIGGTLYGQSVALQSYTNTAATTVTIRFRGYEKDCSNNCSYQSSCNLGLIEDDDYVDNSNAQNITIQDATALCQWRNCGIVQVGTFYFEVRIYWEYANITVPTISADQAICQGATAANLTSTNANLAGVSYVWQTGSSASGPFSNTIQTNPASFTPGAVNTDTYYQLVATGCGSTPGATSNVVGITITPVPSNVTVTGPLNRCQGLGTDAYTGGGTNANAFTWSIAPANAGTIDNAGVVTWDSLYSGTATITTTASNNSCGAVNGTLGVFVTPSPAVFINNLATSFCQNDPAVSLSGLPSGGTFTVDNVPAVDFNPQLVGNDTAIVKYSYTDTLTGCSNRVTQQVIILPLPQLAITGIDSVVCLNSINLALIGSPTGGTFFGPGVTGSTFVAGVVGLGNTDVNYYYTDLNGCTDTLTKNVLVTDVPSTVNLGSDTIICVNLSVTLDAGSGYQSYLWSDGSSSQTLTVSQTGIYEVAAVDANGCINEDQIAVSTAYLLEPIITSTGNQTTFCEGDSLLLDAGSGYTSYLWSDGQTTTSTLWVTVSGQYSIFATDATGCSGQSTPVNVLVNPAPNPTVVSNGPTSFCPGDEVTLCGQPGYVQYQWNNGLTTECVTTNVTSVLQLTVVDQNGCSATSANIQTQVFTILQPVITALGPTEFCAVDANGNPGSVILDVGPGFYSYLWTSGSTTPSISVNQSGYYSVTVMDMNGCIDSTLLATPIQVIVHAPYPQISVSQNTLTSDPAVSYQWHEWQFDAYDTLLVGQTNQTYTFDHTSWYFVVVVDDIGCTGSSDTLLVNYKPTSVEDVFGFGVSIYPNPSQDQVFVEFQNGANGVMEISLSDLSGRVVRTFPKYDITNYSKMELDLTGISVGTYLVNLTKDGKTISHKITKN